ncbi:hypothetical protein [Nocardia acidivorans]|uniref:hypothetical protein n=1 Tax=Nocardia acidivorans TaxID=404580 RepID=UPI0008331011|nr:hypothetical protein [Nocardia acidivorans]
MARHTDHDEIAAEALLVCEAIRELAPLQVYTTLAIRCARDPERMAQVLMCVAAWVDYEGPVSELAKRVDEIVEGRIRAVGQRLVS